MLTTTEYTYYYVEKSGVHADEKIVQTTYGMESG